MTHTNQPKTSPEVLQNMETQESTSVEQVLENLNKILTELSSYQKTLMEQ